MAYIKLEDVLKAVNDIMTDSTILHKFRSLRLRINKLPTADVEEVVRCKDCKKFMPYEWDKHKGDCEAFSELNCCMYEDDFCSYGKRSDT